MTYQNFISRLNWRQILMHFIAFWFLCHAFRTLSYLYDTRLLNIVRHSNNHDLKQTLIDNNVSAADLTYYAIGINSSGLIGLLVAFVISLAISIRRHWFWFNSAIDLLITYVLYRFDLLGWAHLRRVFWGFDQTFGDPKVEFTVKGTLLLIIGLVIFFLKRPNAFIESKKLVTV